MPTAHASRFSQGTEPLSAAHRNVHQAAGMLTVRSNCTIDEALAELHRQAATKRWPIELVAQQVIDHNRSLENP